MAKRKFRREPESEEDDERKRESLTPEERRAQRKRDRQRQKAQGSADRTKRPTWRRVAIVGIPVGVIVAIVVVLIVFSGSLFAPPCLSFGPIPASSGVPAFPAHNTTDFSSTWCPTATPLFQVYPRIVITISGTAVNLPTAIGRNSSYPNHYQCNLPMFTQTTAVGGLPINTLYIVSPWTFTYNLSTFFTVWSESYSGAFVNTSHPNQPIVYQPNDLLGFTADATHSVDLFVDGAPSSSGPSLELNTLDHEANPYPRCLGEKYGTGHTITLSYSSKAPGTARPLPGAGLLLTATVPVGVGHSVVGPSPGLSMPLPQRVALSALALRPN